MPLMRERRPPLETQLVLAGIVPARHAAGRQHPPVSRGDPEFQRLHTAPRQRLAQHAAAGKQVEHAQILDVVATAQAFPDPAPTGDIADVDTHAAAFPGAAADRRPVDAQFPLRRQIRTRRLPAAAIGTVDPETPVRPPRPGVRFPLRAAIRPLHRIGTKTLQLAAVAEVEKFVVIQRCRDDDLLDAGVIGADLAVHDWQCKSLALPHHRPGHFRRHSVMHTPLHACSGASRKTRIGKCRGQIDAALNVSHYFRQCPIPGMASSPCSLCARQCLSPPGKSTTARVHYPHPPSSLAPAYLRTCRRSTAGVPKPASTPGEARCATGTDAASTG
jgi:hypothetical protein